MSAWLSTLLVIFLCPLQAQTTLTVAAASDLTNLEPALTIAFRKNEPKVELKFVTAASAALMQQIENGAPYDVFMSANAGYVDQLASNGKLVPASLTAYAVGQLGILWKDGKHHPFSDLGQSSVKVVALPNPKLAPYGVAAQQSLEHAGLWNIVSPKVVYGENVRQTLQLFESGNADVVLTSDSLMGGKNPEVIQADWHKPIIQKAGIVAASSQQTTAQAFMKFLNGPEAADIFTRYGFSKP